MDRLTEKLLKRDSLLESEEIMGGKHYSQFDKGEQAFSFLKFISDNKEKKEHLQSIGDTYWGMKWNEFKQLIINKGFMKALEYDFVYNGWDTPSTEEAILYYHPLKGLVIWSTSFGNKDHINGGNLYGEIKAKGEEYKSVIWNWLSTGGCIDYENMIYETQQDVREGLFSKIDHLETAGKFLPKWTKKDRFLWFLDYVEEKIEGYDYKAITANKIRMCPKELQNIIYSN